MSELAAIALFDFKLGPFVFCTDETKDVGYIVQHLPRHRLSGVKHCDCFAVGTADPGAIERTIRAARSIRRSRVGDSFPAKWLRSGQDTTDRD